SVTGVWNTKEHISLMIKGAQVMKIMPDSYTLNVDWIPVDMASQSIVDISLNAPFDDEIDYVRVNHILNPKRITWNEFLKFLNKSGIDFKIVSNKEWLNTLLKTPEYQNVDKNPVTALSGFFEKTISESSNRSEEPLFETHKSVDRSLALSNCQKIDNIRTLKIHVILYQDYEAYQHQVSTRPKDKVLLIPNGTKYEAISLQDLDIIINKYVNYWNKHLMNENLNKNSVIGYLAQSNPEYLFNFMALWKLGFQILFLSPRNSESALINLLQETKSRILIYDPQLSKISLNVQNEINSQRPQLLNIFQHPNNLKNDAIDYFAPDPKLDENPYEKIIAIFHSSGSTSFPKLVPLSNRYLLNAVKSNHTHEIVLSIAPLFHIYGFIRALKCILSPGSIYAFPIVAGSIPLANEILYSLKQSNARILHTLPATLEQIYKYYPEEIKTLLNLKSIFYSGAALFPQVGEQLVQSGVKLRNSYGATEIGNLMLTPENLSPDIPWNAMELIVPESNIEWIERNDILDGAKELVIKKSSSILANIEGNTDNGDYRVGDLFIEAKK
ncbi:15325_t:CDS:2, partial [Racocetra fulgida]